MKKMRSKLGLFLLVLLLAGGASHDWHHLLDPHCESGAPGESHPCLSCSALHGATAAEIGALVHAPAAPERDLGAHPEHAAPHVFARGSAATRAPPRA